MVRDIQMEDSSTTVLDHEEAIQHAKRQCGHGEEIHGRNDFAVVSQESGPAFASVVGRRPAPEIAGDRALGDIETEFEELAVDSRCAPGGILIDQPPDDSSDLGIDLRPAKALRA